jgi:hypothetical protein
MNGKIKLFLKHYLSKRQMGSGSRRLPPGYSFVPVATTPVERILARWRHGEVNKATTSDKGGHPCHQSRHKVVVFLFLFILLYSFQYTFILSLEVMGPGGSLSTALGAMTYILARRQSESIFAGSNGDSGIQFQADDDGAHLQNGGWLMVAMMERLLLRRR